MLKDRFFFRFLLWPLLFAASVPAMARESDREVTLTGLRALDQRVTVIGHRLATANLELCGDRRFLPGFALHHFSQYAASERPAAIRIFGFGAGPGVLALVPEGPAQRDGVRRDDVVLAVDGAALPRAAEVPRQGGFAQMELILDAFDRAFADGRALLSVRRGEVALSIAVEGVSGCASRFQLIPGNGLNARADGEYVQVTTALAQYAADDQELAAILAHEFAHNVLRHRRRLDDANVRRGLLGNFGRNARLTRETELEADRLAPYLLERAGYDPDAAVRFWRRFGNRGLNIFGSPTHGGWGRRAEAIQTEVVRIRQARAAGRVPVPAFVQLPLPPLPAG